jgi:hypothetical protein
MLVVPAPGLEMRLGHLQEAQDVAGRRDFTTDEWATMQRAMMASGVLVSLAEGVADADEIYGLTKELRSARFAHRSQLIRELADVPDPDTRRLQQDTTYATYRDPGLAAIRSATDIVARKAPAELPEFQDFLVVLAEVVADANREGSILGVGAQRRTPNEAAAVDAIRRALGL